MKIQYSDKALTAKSELYKPYNDVSIFIEDTTLVGVYNRIVKKILGNEFNFHSVVALNGKKNVLETAKSKINDNKSLFIVDGDFDFIAVRNYRPYRNVYVLNCYSIENLLFSNKAAEKIIGHLFPEIEEREALNRVDLEYINEQIYQLRKLFIIYATAHRLKFTHHDFRIECTSISTQYNGHPVGIDYTGTRNKTLKLSRKLRDKFGRNRYKSALKAVIRNIEQKRITHSQIVPGKEFHIKLLVGRVAAGGGTPIKQRIILSLLADHFAPANDPNLSRRIRAAAKS